MCIDWSNTFKFVTESKYISRQKQTEPWSFGFTGKTRLRLEIFFF